LVYRIKCKQLFKQSVQFQQTSAAISSSKLSIWWCIALPICLDKLLSTVRSLQVLKLPLCKTLQLKITFSIINLWWFFRELLTLFLSLSLIVSLLLVRFQTMFLFSLYFTVLSTSFCFSFSASNHFNLAKKPRWIHTQKAHPSFFGLTVWKKKKTWHLLEWAKNG
jgi:hypothetical protein